MTKYKLQEIAKITTGLPVQRYTKSDDLVEQKIITNMPVFDFDEKFDIEEINISKDIKDHFKSREHDILYKIQQHNFAKEVTTETDAIIPNSYLIIRADEKIVNPTFLTYYLNDPRIEYEIQRSIDSTKIRKVNTKILKDLIIELPPLNQQNIRAELIAKINKKILLKRKSIECDKQLINSLYDNIIGDSYESS